MKKIYTIFLFSTFSLQIVLAQNLAIPNANFEAWTHVSGFTAYDNPDNWNTLNSTTASYGVITCFKATAASEHHAGAAALKLITKNVVVQVAQGIATTGALNTTTQVITGGIAYTGRPDSIVGWYKCSPVNGDAGFIQFMLMGATNDTIGYAKFFAPTTMPTTAFTRFAQKIVYTNTNTPVTSQWITSSSAGNTNQQINATIWIDDLDFSFISTAIHKAELESGIKVGPNPITENTLFISNERNLTATMTLYDVMGKSFGSFDVSNPKTAINLSGLAAGTYLYSVINNDRVLILSSKITIVK